MKSLSVVALASCVLLASMPREAGADGERGTRTQEASYAGRELQSSADLAEFRGGCMSEGMVWFFVATLPVWIALSPVILLIYGVSELCSPKGSYHHLPAPEKEETGRADGPSATTAKTARSAP